MNDLYEGPTDRVNGVMPIQAFLHEPIERRSNRRFISKQDLILYHHVGHRVHLGILKPHAGAAMIVHDKFQTLGLIERGPSLSVRLAVRVIAHHPHKRPP